MNTKVKIAGGFLLGAAVGVVTALILAPTSGKDTRKRIKAESKRLSHDLIEKANESLMTAKKSYNEKVDHYAKKGKSSIDQISEDIRVQ